MSNFNRNTALLALMKAANRGSQYADTSGEVVGGHALELIYNGADANAQDDEGNTALMLAASGGKCRAISSLLREGANLHLRNNRGQTALMLAVESGDYPTVKYITNYKQDFEVRDNEGKTALDYCSTFSSSREAIRYDILLSTLRYAVRQKNMDRVVELGTSHPTLDKSQALKDAVIVGDVEITGFLLPLLETELHVFSEKNERPIKENSHYMSYEKREELRLEKERVLKTRHVLKDLLGLASKHGRLEVINFLIDSGFWEIAKTSLKPPFTKAIKHRQDEAAKLLMHRDAVDMGQRDQHGRTAFDFCSQSHDFYVILWGNEVGMASAAGNKDRILELSRVAPIRAVPDETSVDSTFVSVTGLMPVVAGELATTTPAIMDSPCREAIRALRREFSGLFTRVPRGVAELAELLMRPATEDIRQAAADIIEDAFTRTYVFGHSSSAIAGYERIRDMLRADGINPSTGGASPT